MKKTKIIFAVAFVAALATLLLFAALPSGAAKDGFKRKDGIAAKATAVSSAEAEDAVFEIEIVNESCAYADKFKVTASGLDGKYEAKIEPATLTLAEGGSGKAGLTVSEAAADVETAETEKPVEKKGCGSALPAAAALAAALGAFVFVKGKKGRAALLCATLALIPALFAAPAGAAVTHRSLDLTASCTLGGEEISFTVSIEYDYDFTEEETVKTTGIDEFGITYYWGPHGEQATDETFWKAIAECGFTTVPLENNTYENNKIALGYMKKYGLTCSALWDGRIAAISYGSVSPTREVLYETVRQVVADYAEFDNIKGWWLYDEPGADKFPVLAELTAAFREIDPERTVFIDLFPNYASKSQLGGYTYESYVSRYLSEVKPQYVCYDHYHFLKTGARAGFYTNLETVRKQSLENNLDYMTIILLTKHNSYADLTRGQILMEVTSALAYGCKRISYFTFINDPDLIAQSWDNACMSYTGEIYPHYYDVQAVNEIALPLGRELYGKRSTAVFHLNAGSNAELVRYEGYGDLGQVDGRSFLIGFFDDGSFMIANRKYSEGEYGHNSLEFIDVKEGLEYFDPADSTWKDYSQRNESGNYILEVEAGEAVLFRVK